MAFTYSGPGTAGSALSVSRFGAVGDGTADDTAALNATYAAAVAQGRGVLLEPGASYKVSGSGLNMNANAHIRVTGYGSTIIPSGSATGITFDPGVATGDGLGAIVEGMAFRPTAPQTQTSIKIRSASRLAVRDVNIYSGTNGILLSNDGARAGGYCEDNHFENIYVASAAVGLKFEKINTGNVSLEENFFEHISIAGCTTGLWMGPGLEFRSVFMTGIKLWATSPGSQTCMLLEGDLFDWYATSLHFENLAPSTGNTGIHCTSTAANLDKAHIDLGRIGTFTTWVVVDAGTIALIYRNGTRIEFGGKTGGAGLTLRRDTDTQDRFQVVASPPGINLGPGGSSVPNVNLYWLASNQLKTDDLLVAADGVATKTKAGTPTDADFQATPPDGTMVADTTANKLWMRLGGTWKSITLA